VQTNFTPGKVQRIIEEQPSDQFYNKNFGHYDCAIEEGALTTTQRQLAFLQKQSLKEMGYNIPIKDMLAEITVQNKKQMIESMEQEQQQAAQQAQQQQQIQMAEIEANIGLAKARTSADFGLYAERTSRVEENRALAVQKLSEANKNDEQALLEKIKILKEIEDMDIGHIERLLNMANSLKVAEQSSVQKPQPLAQSVQQQ